MDSDSTLQPEDAKILLDRTRIQILKILGERRHTLSELSKRLNLSKTTVLHHLKILEKSGYIVRVDEGRKWIYYELSDDGRAILRWKTVRVAILLAIFILSGIAMLAERFKPPEPVYPAMGGAGISVAHVLFGVSAFLALIYLYWWIKVRKRPM
ncbi:winged helix-turn-helix domain-containing protein [Geoglobus ahangari]